MQSNKTITTAKKISGDQDGDASLFGGILTNHAERLFDMTQSASAQVRFASLELISVLLKQGQVNPNDAVPFLFALQGDSETPEIRELALQLLMTEAEKRPDMLRQRIRVGVKKAYDFQRSLYPNKEVSALTKVRRGDTVSTECVFSNVFKECVVRNRKQRLGFYGNLLGLFVVPDAIVSEGDLLDEAAKHPNKRRKSSLSKSSGATPAVDVDLICFASQILAHLPYESSGDPLYIIHEINATIWLHGERIVEGFASILRTVGLASSDELDESNSSEDALERVARAKFPSRTKEAKALSSPEFDMLAFANLCREGAALTLLLRLKNFLRRLYNLSGVRIQEYDPNGKETIADKGITKSTTASKTFDSSLGIGGSSPTLDDSNINLDPLIRVYAEFRLLVRSELSDPDVTHMDMGDEEDDAVHNGAGMMYEDMATGNTSPEATPPLKHAPQPHSTPVAEDRKPPARKRRGAR